MRKAAAIFLALGLTSLAAVVLLASVVLAQNRPPAQEPDFGDYCTYGGQIYSLGASICVGREVAIKCVRYSTVINDLRDLNANVDDQQRNRPVWLNIQQKLC